VRVNQLKSSYELSKLEIKKQELETQQNLLRLELETLKDPKRIIKIAKSKLGLFLPSDKNIMRLE